VLESSIFTKGGTYIYHYAMKTEISLIDISGLNRR